MPRFVQPIGIEVGPQQGELDQVVLRAATADAFVLSRSFVQPTVDPLPTKIVQSQWRLELYKFLP